MLARTEAKIRAKEAEIQRKLEEQKMPAGGGGGGSSWRRGDPPSAKDEGGSVWRAATKGPEPRDAEKKEPWRAGKRV